MAFRLKLMLVVVAAVLALGLQAGGSVLLADRVQDKLATIEGKLLPKAELGPKLEVEFTRLRHALQDAVTAQDRGALDETLAVKIKLLDLLTARSEALEPGAAAKLRWAIQNYYDAAYSVSAKMIEGRTGESLVQEIELMQQRQRTAESLIQTSTGLSQKEIGDGFEAVRQAQQEANRYRWQLGIGTIVLVLGLSAWASRGLVRGVQDLSHGLERFARGDFSRPIVVGGSDELATVARAANRMAETLRDAARTRDRTDWLNTAAAGMEDALRGELALSNVTQNALDYLVHRLGAVAGALYVSEDDGGLRLAAACAGAGEPREPQSIAPLFGAGEGLVGHAATRREIWTVSPAPADYLKIRSGLGDAEPTSLVFVPLLHSDTAVGVIELAFFEPCSEQGLQLLSRVQTAVAIAIAAARSRAALQVLLAEARRQAEQLAAQEEELRVNNQELQLQQQELRQANAELSAQRKLLSERNLELEDARQRVQQKAEEIARVSTYKSQFLANMSHELRTPLNSMLVLSQLLADNESQNLTERQVEYCRTIHSAGRDLLALINQVLDLAKIEAGRQEVEVEDVELVPLADQLRRVFAALARDKGIELSIEVEDGAPRLLRTDRGRLERILNNLLGNAVKFTDRGSVSLRIGRPDPNYAFERSGLVHDKVVAFVVKDTGIGITAADLERIFAPFEQLESHSNRRYGGTGLGLAIARESAILLGGELRVTSIPDEGSTFTCCLPEGAALASSVNPNESRELDRATASVPDDRASLAPGDAHLLVIEDDAVFAEQLVEIIHARHFKVVVTGSGQEGLRLARELVPTGIILDVKLPDLEGWTVMERLRAEPTTAAIPVHFMSALSAAERGLAMGAVGYLTKPASRAELLDVVRALTPSADSRLERVLVVEDSMDEGESILSVLAKAGISARHVATAADALSAIQAEPYGCMILDLGLPDMDGLGLLERLSQQSELSVPPVIVHTGRALSKLETQKLEAYVESVVLKDGSSKQRLLEEVRLFVGKLRERKETGEGSRELPGDFSLNGVKLLLAEDDMRTVYALCALLRGKGAEVVVADTGASALQMLALHPDVRIVLMDIMMPEMDGYDAMRHIRADARHANLPVIALTAKAMKGERERCLEAGASDYLSKPVDGSVLLATLHRWLNPEVSRVAE